MNDAHWHLLVNHFPIIGVIFGLGIQVSGILLKNNVLKNTAFVLYLITAIFGFLAMQTGENAEEVVENLPNISENLIHRHEESAETFVLVLYAAGVFAVFSLVASVKKYRFAGMLSYLTLAVVFLAAVLSKNVGTSGGEIIHTEIRNDTTLPADIGSHHGTDD